MQSNSFAASHTMKHLRDINSVTKLKIKKRFLSGWEAWKHWGVSKNLLKEQKESKLEYMLCCTCNFIHE